MKKLMGSFALKATAFIGLICMLWVCVGGALGVLGMFCMPDFPAQDSITACAVGIVSGLAATGMDQMVKQLWEGDETDG